MKASFLPLSLPWHSVPLGTQSLLALSPTWHSVSLTLKLSLHSVSLALGLLGTQSLGTRSLGALSPWHSVPAPARGDKIKFSQIFVSTYIRDLVTK